MDWLSVLIAFVAGSVWGAAVVLVLTRLLRPRPAPVHVQEDDWSGLPEGIRVRRKLGIR